MFYRAGYIEHWGRGIQKIFDACKELGAEPPVYKIVGNGLRVRFKALESALIGETDAEENSGGDVHTQKGVEKSVEKIIRAIKENPQITVKELTTLIGLSRRGVEKNIKNLKQKGIICRIGPDKGGHWEVIPQQ